MDLITSLPTSDSFDAIFVIVDRFSKMAHFIPTNTTADAPTLASLFITNIVRIHGIPRSIISDRDPRFVSTFWRELFEQLQTTLRFSTANHPQTDGQTERTIAHSNNISNLFANHTNQTNGTNTSHSQKSHTTPAHTQQQDFHPSSSYTTNTLTYHSTSFPQSSRHAMTHPHNSSMINAQSSKQHTKTSYALATICKNHPHNANQATSTLATSYSCTKQLSAHSPWHHRPSSMIDGMDHSKSSQSSTLMLIASNSHHNSNHTT